MSLTEISGEDKLFLFPILLDLNFDDGRTKDMACISKLDSHAFSKRKDLIVMDRVKISEAFLRILKGVERFSHLLCRPSILAVLPFGLHLLNVSAIPEHDVTEIEGCLGTEDLSSKPSPNKLRNQPTVIDVSMGQKDDIELLGLVGSDVPVSSLDLFSSLEHPTIHQPFQWSLL